MPKHIVTICLVYGCLAVLLSACTSAANSTPARRTPTANSTPPLPSVTNSSALQNAVQTPQILDWNGLTLEEYGLPSDQENSLPDGGEFYSSLPASLFEKQQALLQSDEYGPTITQTNSILAPFGYRFEGDFEYTLYAGNELLKEGLPSYGSISVSQSRQDFVTIAGAWDNTWLVRKGVIEPWDKPSHFHQSPFYIGEDLLMVTQVMTEDERFGVRVERDGEAIFEQPISYWGPEGCPVEQFREWQGHWVLEIEADVIIDGASLAQKQGYEQIFTWALMDNKPLYVFQKAGRFGVGYDGQELPLQYDQIIHYGCVERHSGPGPYTIAQNSHILSFFAFREGRWHFVQILPQENVR